MSIEVTLPELAAMLARYRFAYLLTVGDDARAHVVAVTPVLAGGSLQVGDLGRRTRANVAVRSAVTLVWPPADPADHTLIVDGNGVLRDGSLVIAPTRAVLHRPAPAPVPAEAGACEADCVELPVT
ncbi:hypothetical protein [Pseudonocardia sp. GCM10023141]|uniref:hypothetical protein n=1 Tax=Pseudonocardia sp. GCM10023141 TaxID=3252653 RepID=UPI003618AD85